MTFFWVIFIFALRAGKAVRTFFAASRAGQNSNKEKPKTGTNVFVISLMSWISFITSLHDCVLFLISLPLEDHWTA